MRKNDMPTYDYECTACGHEFEKFQSITAARTRKCPKCHKSQAHRRISAGGGFLFKGSGFYVTDYRKGSAPKTETSKTETCAAADNSKTCKSCPNSPANKGK
jgi:putative FmdB family regulatory protein